MSCYIEGMKEIKRAERGQRSRSIPPEARRRRGRPRAATGAAASGAGVGEDRKRRVVALVCRCS